MKYLLLLLLAVRCEGQTNWPRAILSTNEFQGQPCICASNNITPAQCQGDYNNYTNIAISPDWKGTISFDGSNYWNQKQIKRALGGPTNYDTGWGFDSRYQFAYTNDGMILVGLDELDRFTLSTNLSTNWITVSHTTPVLQEDEYNDAVARFGSSHQDGYISRDIYGNINWHGTNHTVVLDSQYVGKTERDVSDCPNLIQLTEMPWVAGTNLTITGQSVPTNGANH